MGVTLMPVTLADLGETLWGPRWVVPMAEALKVTEEQVVKWDAQPETIPAALEDRIAATGTIRLQEIRMVLAQLDMTGLDRTPKS